MKITFTVDEHGKADISSSLDNYDQPADLSMLEKQVALYIKRAFQKNNIDFDKSIRFRRRSQSYLTLIAPNDIDFCRIKAGLKSVWFSVDSWSLNEEKKNDARFNNVKNRKIRYWKVELNCIEDFENNADLIVDTYKSLDLSNTTIHESEAEQYDLESVIPFIQQYQPNPKAHNYIINDYTIIDLETTGLSTKSCEIIELAAVKVRNGKIIDTFGTLIKPNVEIPYAVTQKTNITNEMVENAPKIDEKFQDFFDFIGDDIVLGHNINSYDIPILCRYCEELNSDSFNNDTLDTLQFSRKCDIDVPDYKLTTLTNYFGIEHQNAHRALADCIANHECYQRLKELYNPNLCAKNKSTGTRKHISRLSEETKQLQELSCIINDFISDNVLTDIEISSLNHWLNQNQHLSGNYLFDKVNSAVQSVLEDGVITEEEKLYLLNVLSNYNNPVEFYSGNVDELNLDGKQVVLTGDFIYGSRDEVTNKLEMLGASVKSSVSGKTDYVVVGGNGSEVWSCGNYGSKVKKALEYQSKGKDVKIIKEEEFFKCLKETV